MIFLMNNHYDAVRAGAQALANALEGITDFRGVSDRFFLKRINDREINATTLYGGPSTDAHLSHSSGKLSLTIPQFRDPIIDVHLPADHFEVPEGYEVVGRNGTLHLRTTAKSIEALQEEIRKITRIRRD
ncbi:MAG: hypothetical protein AABW73_01175 [Nanoarchaeota archaeon]